MLTNTHTELGCLPAARAPCSTAQCVQELGFGAGHRAPRGSLPVDVPSSFSSSSWCSRYSWNGGRDTVFSSTSFPLKCSSKSRCFPFCLRSLQSPGSLTPVLTPLSPCCPPCAQGPGDTHCPLLHTRGWCRCLVGPEAHEWPHQA